MSPRQIALVRSGMEMAAPQRNRVVALFLAQLLAREPRLRFLFRGDLRAHGRELFDGLAGIVASLDRLHAIAPALEWLATRGARHGIGARHYRLFADALIAALAAELGERFTRAMEQAWCDAAGAVATMMMSALDAEPIAA